MNAKVDVTRLRQVLKALEIGMRADVGINLTAEEIKVIAPVLYEVVEDIEERDKICAFAQVYRAKFLTGRWFRLVWDALQNGGSYGDAFKVAYWECNRIRTNLALPEYDLAKFTQMFDCRSIFHDDWTVARDEFASLVLGRQIKKEDRC